ncbi:hypothetical protein BKA08_000414 [Nocardioides marinisabuli]|uniref:Uncharacterized protein n=1 Tax=Nocardioides marinisabuli TaxID=419476 RepID=A0A7Y9EYQ7_9ACTN|nr:hypothetical protein [Nocardioides marinisabuli]NYD56176.1 hypothetical protein [Nocardioides marinisabuli]
MGDEVRVSEQGVRQLVSAAHEQYLNLSEASGFAAQAGLGDTGAFRGILGLFRGTYEDAWAALSQALDEGLQDAQELSVRMDAALEDLLATDHHIQRDLDLIRTDVTDADEVHLPAGGDPIPGTPTAVSHLNTITSTPWHLPGPQPPTWAGESTTGAPVSLASETASMAGHASDTGDAMTTDDDIDDFLEEHDQ